MSEMLESRNEMIDDYKEKNKVLIEENGKLRMEALAVESQKNSNEAYKAQLDAERNRLFEEACKIDARVAQGEASVLREFMHALLKPTTIRTELQKTLVTASHDYNTGHKTGEYTQPVTETQTTTEE